MQIDGRAIGANRSPFVIAEVSANHDGSLSRAIEVIHAAKEAGADAIKLQHYTPETITVRSEHPDFQVKGGTLWDGRQLADLYAEAMTPWEWTEELVAAAKQARPHLVLESVRSDGGRLPRRTFDMPAYKIASFEIIDLPLDPLRGPAGQAAGHLHRDGDPRRDRRGRRGSARSWGASRWRLLRCNSGYPAVPDEMDLRAIPVMEQIWQVPIGLSDHTHRPHRRGRSGGAGCLHHREAPHAPAVRRRA